MFESLEIDERAVRLLFTEARSNTRFADTPVPLESVRAAYELARWGPTGNNAVPLRLVVASSDEARAKVIAAASDSNQVKLGHAPLVLVVASDLRYHDYLDITAPGSDAARQRLELAEDERSRKAHDGTWLQAGYLIVALRAAGLAVRPLGGFDRAALDASLLTGTSWRSEMLLMVGLPPQDDHGAGPRKGRLGWEQAAAVL